MFTILFIHYSTFTVASQVKVAVFGEKRIMIIAAIAAKI